MSRVRRAKVGGWAGASLDDSFTHAGEVFTLRFGYIHMIGEYARHNGHADLLRERVDGVT